MSKIIFFLILIIINFSIFSNELLTLNEKKWLKNNKEKLIFAPDPNYAPIDFFDKDGNHKGIAADYFQLVQKKIGIKFKILKLNSWEEVINYGKKGKIAGTTSANKTEERLKFWSFTKPYIEYSVVIIVNKTKFKKSSYKVSDFKSSKIGIVKGYSIENYLKNRFSNIKFNQFLNSKTLIKKLSTMEIDVALMNLPDAAYYIDKEKAINLKIVGELDYKYKISIAINKDYPILKNIFEKSLNSITKEEKKKIFDKWIHLSVNNQNIYSKNKKTIWIINISIVSLLLLIFIWNRSLKKAVNKRSEELEKELKEKEIIENKFKYIFNSTTEGVIIYNFDTDTVQDSNRSIKKMLKIDKMESLTPLFSEKTSKKDIFLQHLEIAKEGKIELFDWKIDKLNLWLEISIKKIIFFNKNIAIIVLRDVTEKVKDRMQLKKQEKIIQKKQKIEALGQLAGEIAHDFNNLLAGIIGATEIIDIDENDSNYEYFNMIKNLAHKGGDLISQLLIATKKEKNSIISIQKDKIKNNKHISKLIESNGKNGVLIVDDEDIIHKTLTPYFLKKEFKVLNSKNGCEAINTFQIYQDKINFIILDMIMPNMDGEECFYKIREINKDIPIIISSGFSADGVLDRLKKKKNVYFLNKPYKFSELDNLLFKKL